MPAITGNAGPPPGGVGFSPTSIAGCQLWLDAADTSAASMTLSGSTVTVWKDKSGNGNATTTKIGSPIQSAQGITVTTSDKFYMDPIVNPPTGSYLTFFITATLAATGSQYGRLVSFAKQSDGTANNDFSSVANFTICQAGTNQQIAIYRNGGPQFTQNITYGTPFLLSIVWDGTNETAYFNGTSLGSVGNTGTFGFNRLGLGVNINTKDTVNDRWAGTMSEILMYYSAFTTTDRQTIEGYLAQKWGLTLPPGHPGLTASYSGSTPPVFRIGPLPGTHAPLYVRENQAAPPLTLTTTTFAATGAAQTFTVPATTSSVNVFMWGAAGGGGYVGGGNTAKAGAGAYVQGTLAVTPGATITIVVGKGGIAGSQVTTYGGGGAGISGNTCGSGGGRSAIQFTAGTDIVTVAGGGGGGYYGTNGTGGWGDATTGTGTAGSAAAGGNAVYGGKGGTQSAGGAAGQENHSGNPTAGSKYQGGNGSTWSGAGGGGGYYGGGGGGAGEPIGGGGGGGSSLTTALTSFVGYNSSDGFSTPFAGTYNPSSIYGTAGGPGSTGGDGRVVLVYYQ